MATRTLFEERSGGEGDAVIDQQGFNPAQLMLLVSHFSINH